MTEPIIENVSDTALWVAVYREQETARPDALFRDPLASRLVGERGRQIEKQMQGSQYAKWGVIIRTCIIDHFLQELVAQGVDTVINLGCGLDTRPYRLDLPPTLRWVEVDFPQIIQLKETRLAGEKPKCQLQRVSLDLTNSVLSQQFFTQMNSECKNAVILTEGVIPYLTEQQVAGLAKSLRAQKNFRHWIVDYYSNMVMRHMNNRVRRRQMKNAPFVFDPKDWFEFFRAKGWRKNRIRYLAEESVARARSIPMPWWAHILLFIFRSKNSQARQQYAGFVILEPQ